MNKKPFLLLIMPLIFVFSLNLIFSAGCCFVPSNGLCGSQAEYESCVNNGGEYFNDPSCNIEKCEKGCCVLGSFATYATSRECEVQAEAYGFEYNFLSSESRESCSLIATRDIGACLFKEEYPPYDCLFVSRDNCPTSDFYPNSSCTTPLLQSKCNSTNNKMCYNEQLYSMDSCGNPDKLLDACKYDTGKICKNLGNKNAECRSLDCVDKDGKKRKHGESWCIELFDSFPQELKAELTGNSIFDITGKLITGYDICTDPETGESYYCESPDSGGESTALPSGGSSSTTPSSGVCGELLTMQGKDGEILTCDPSWDLCGEDMCNRCMRDVAKLGGDSKRVKGCVFGERCKAEQTPAPVGSRSYKQYCLNGEVITEPCADFRNEICKKEGENISQEAKCEVNLGDECLAATLTDEESGKVKIDKSACDEEHCTIFAPGGEGENANPFITELGLDMCLPKLPTGFEFYNSKAGSGSICSYGDFEAEVYFESDKGSNPQWALAKEANADDYINFDDTHGYAAIISANVGAWAKDTQEHNRYILYSCNPAYGAGGSGNGLGIGAGEAARGAKALNKLASDGKIPDPGTISALVGRCQAIGDCAGKTNWLGTAGSAESEFFFNCKATSTEAIKCTFSFKCVPWKAPAGDADCSKCGEDGLACSEYKCRSLGKKCEYKEPEGIDKGYCTKASDGNPPLIRLLSINPASPIPPYTAATFRIATDEISECKFNLDSPGTKYSEMKYNFGESYSLNHSVTLTLPGQTRLSDIEDEVAYSLIAQGNHTLYVRCLDVRGNGEFFEPFKIKFEVMQTPDKIPPAILSFNPVSGSPIMFNTTRKNIDFKINEPSECKWDFEDKAFLAMNYSFNCDESITAENLISGYSCSGTLFNITRNMSLETKFYIRCKDQPWLEGKEDNLYKRNTNDRSEVYILRPSEALVIDSVYPLGTLIKGGDNSSTFIGVITSKGAFGGVASCSWKQSATSKISGVWINFSNTNSYMHRHLLVWPNIGMNYVAVQCQDSAGNVAAKNFSFTLMFDRSSPILSRIFYDAGLLKLTSDENSRCYYSFDKLNPCSFAFENATEMSGAELEHSTTWEEDKTYYVKCQDYWNNLNPGCAAIIRTY